MRLHKLHISKLAKLPDGYHSDGGNLYLRVKGGSRSWVFRYTQNKIPHELGLGGLAYVPISEARKKAAQLRLALANGETIHVKKAQPRTVLFKEVVFNALEWRYGKSKNKSAEFYKKTLTSLAKRHVLSKLGSLPLEEVTAPRVADLINSIDLKSVKQRIPQLINVVFAYAISKQLTTAQPPVGFEAMVVPTKKKQKHLSSLPAEGTKLLIKQIINSENYTHAYIALVILTASRPGELIKSLKQENIDYVKKTFTLYNTKNGKDFVVPYPTQAEPLLKRFKDGVSLHHKGVLTTLRAITGGDYTMHGFRSTFSTWCAENGEDSELREACLNHTPSSQVVSAYQRSDMLARRRVLMQKWANFLLE